MKYCVIIILTLHCFISNADNIKQFNDTRNGIKRLGVPPPNDTRNGIKRLGVPPPTRHENSRKRKNKEAETITAVIDASLRTWTSNKGNTIRAKLTGLNAVLAIFEKENGKKIKIKRSELSDTDQKYLEYYETTGDFPSKYTRKKIIIGSAAVAIFLLFAAWFLTDKHKKPKYQTPKRNITIGTGL